MPPGPLLPMDVMYEVINQLAPSGSDVAYVYEPNVSRTLYSLCLVCRDTHLAARQRLYECITLRTQTDISRLLESGIPHRSFIRSLLLLRDPSLNMLQISHLLKLVSPTLERLMLQDPFIQALTCVITAAHNPLDHEHDYGDLPALRQFVGESNLISVPGSPDLPVAHRWPNLRRLACRGAHLVNKLEHFHTLEVVVMELTESREELDVIERIIVANPSLKHLLFIIPSQQPPSHMTAAEKKALALAYADRLYIGEVYASNLSGFFVLHAQRGSIWNLQGTSWSSFPDPFP